MAATTSTQPQPYLSQHHQQAYTTPPNSQGHPQYSLINQQQYSPRAPHPHSGSPNSPASPYYAHHQGQSQNQAQSLDFPYDLNLASARKDKQPQYIPAALRPTDRPLRSHPLTPPRSLHGSSDSLVEKKSRRAGSRPSSHRSNTTSTISDPSFPPPPTSSSSSSAGSSTTTVRPASKSSDLLAHIPADSLRAALAPASLKDLPPITAPATRAHWKADANSPVCDFPICQKCFGIFERRHHCRRCGNVFCAEHSNERVPLDQNAGFHPEGEKVRGCEECAREWVEWVEARVRRMKDGAGGAEGKGAKKTTTTGPMALMVAKNGGGGGSGAGAAFGAGGDAQKVPAVVAGSVSGDWSTF